MPKFVSDHLKTKKTRKNIVKKLSFVTIYVFDQYKTQEICNKVITENFGVLRFIPDCYKYQKKYVIKLLIIIFMH